MLSEEFSALFERDLNKVILQIKAFPDEGQLWITAPGVTNSAGNLVLHLEGNLREYVGRQLGGIAYVRERPKEFAERFVPANDLLQRIESVKEMVPAVIKSLNASQLNANYPENVLGYPMTAQYFLIHLHGHLNYHLGQIDYLRRILTGNGAL
jgi:DinB superfamily